jgi:DNA polymerase-1
MTNPAPGRRKVFLIDGTNYLFRAFFAIRGLANSRGFPTNAVFGFTRCSGPARAPRITWSWCSTRREDLSRRSIRRVQGTGPDSRTSPQIPVVRDLVRASRIGQLGRGLNGRRDRDADEAPRGQEVDTVIVTGDKDLLQLVGPVSRAGR